MIVIEILRGGPRKKEFYFRLMGANHKEIWRSSETYKRKATMMKTVRRYCYNFIASPGGLVDLTTKPKTLTLNAPKKKIKK